MYLVLDLLPVSLVGDVEGRSLAFATEQEAADWITDNLQAGVPVAIPEPLQGFVAIYSYADMEDE